MQIVGDLFERHHLGTKFGRQGLGTLQGAVGHHHLGDVLLAQMTGHQFNGFTSTDQQHLGLGEIGEDPPTQTDGGKGHRHGTGANLGIGAHPFGHRERFLEQPLQRPLHRLRLLGMGIGLLDLPQDLRLPQHQRVEPARHPHQVAHRLFIVMLIDGSDQFGRVQPVELLQPAQHLLLPLLFEIAIEFGPVAGGDDHRLADTGLAHQLTQGAIDAVRAKGDPFPQGDTGGVVVDSEGKQTHEWATIISYAGCKGCQLYEKG